jgi:hypothetical protein
MDVEPIRKKAMRFSAYLLVVTALLSSASPLAAQSLADVAKQEQDRRKTVKNAGKVPPPQVVSSGDGKDTPTTNADGNPAPADAVDGEPNGDTKDAAPKGEAFWRARIAAARQQLDKDITYAAAMQTRINALTTDFVNRDDAAQRSVIANDRDRAMAELKNLEAAIQKDKDAIAGIEEEARKANVPSGWLR